MAILVYQSVDGVIFYEVDVCNLSNLMIYLNTSVGGLFAHKFEISLGYLLSLVFTEAVAEGKKCQCPFPRSARAMILRGICDMQTLF